MAEPKSSNRGFAAMDPIKQREIASKGGKATGGKNLTHEDRVRGGKASRGGGRQRSR